MLSVPRRTTKSPRSCSEREPKMGGTRRRRGRAEPTDEWEQLELLCGCPEQRDYELTHPLVLFGSPAAGRASETGAASERTLQRRAAARLYGNSPPP